MIIITSPNLRKIIVGVFIRKIRLFLKDNDSQIYLINTLSPISSYTNPTGKLGLCQKVGRTQQRLSPVSYGTVIKCGLWGVL